MVFHVGIDPWYGKVSYCNEFEKITVDITINEVNFNEIEKVAIIYYEYTTFPPKGCLLKARITAGDSELAHLNVLNYLNNEMTLTYGNQEILSVKITDELPIRYFKKFIKDGSYNTVDVVTFFIMGKGKEKFEIPNSDNDIFLTFEIDKNGIYSLKFNSPAVCRLFSHPEIYRNLSFPKGLALIINNRFEGKNERKGTEIDEQNIRQRFSQLGYKVFTKENLTAVDMLKTAKSFANNDKHKFYDSCVVFVLTHGIYDHFLGVDNKEVNVHEFLQCFNAENAPLLKGKPKLFFVQACRGSERDYGTSYPDSHNQGASEQLTTETPSLSPTLMPIEGDMIIAYSTPPNYVSYRRENRGSWFIESVCNIIGEYARTEEICSILTKVNQRVAKAEIYPEDRNGFIKQIPRFESSLTKKFYFVLPGTDMDERNISLSPDTHKAKKPNSVFEVLMNTID
uniref:Caspase-8 n=1 Tax=Panagrolaimus davidi TaxID=227884 RepID=A0A914QUZ1_9BILA